MDAGDGPSPLFAGGEIEVAPVAEPVAVERDLRVELNGVVLRLGPADLWSVQEFTDEVNTTSRDFTMGQVEAMLTAFANEGGLECIQLGDPPAPRFRRPSSAKVDLRRGVLVEIAGLPTGDELNGVSCAQIVSAMNDRSGSDLVPEDVQPLLDQMVSLGVLASRVLQVETDGVTLDVAFYDFAPGKLYTAWTAGFDALFAPARAAGKPASEAEVDKMSQSLNKAMQARLEAERKMALWRERLEKRGLGDIVEELDRPVAPAAADSRRPFLFRERMPINDALAARFFRDSARIRADIRSANADIELAKKNANSVKTKSDARIAELETQISEMEKADAEGVYLLITNAYYAFNPDTRQTEIRAMSDDRLLRIATPEDIKAGVSQGQQVSLPGVDMPVRETAAEEGAPASAEATPDDESTSEDGEQPSEDAPKKRKGKGKRKGKSA